MNKSKRIPFYLKLLFAIWVGVGTYTLLFFTMGSRGTGSYEKLNKEYSKVLKNFEAIQSTNKELDNMGILLGAKDDGSMKAIPPDPETIRIKAWEIGYGNEGDHLVRISNLEPAPNLSPGPGEASFAFYPKGVPDSIMKGTACFFALVVLIALCFQEILDFIEDPPRRQRRARLE